MCVDDMDFIFNLVADALDPHALDQQAGQGKSRAERVQERRRVLAVNPKTCSARRFLACGSCPIGFEPDWKQPQIRGRF